MPASPQIAVADHSPSARSPNASGGQRADARAHEQDEACVDAIGQRREHRDRQHVAERIGAGHQPGLGAAQSPQRHEMLGHDGRHDDVRQQVADLPEAHGGDEGPPGQMPHCLLSPVLLVSAGDPSSSRRLSEQRIPDARAHVRSSGGLMWRNENSSARS